MRAPLTELVHVGMSLPFWVLVALAASVVASYRAAVTGPVYPRRYLVLAAFVLVYLMSAPVVSNAVVRHLETRFSPPTHLSESEGQHVIVVLTAGWLRFPERGYEVKLSEDGWERTNAAVELWRRIGGTLLFVGAPTPDGRDSAAAHMARVARQWGVPEKALATETRSLNTYENLVYSVPLIERYLSRGGRVWLVTSALHMPRAMAVARNLEIDPIPYPVHFRASEKVLWTDWLPRNEGPAFLQQALHELFGMLLYRLRGWT